MGCKIIFGGQTYTEPQFREKLKEGLLAELIAKGKFKEEDILKMYQTDEKFEEISNIEEPIDFTSEEYYHLTKALVGIIIDEKETISEINKNKKERLVTILSNKILEKLQSGTLTEKQTVLLNKALKDINKGRKGILVQNVTKELSDLWNISLKEDIIDFTEDIEDYDNATLRKWDSDASLSYNYKDRTAGEIKMLFYFAKKLFNDDSFTGFNEPLDFNEEYVLVQQLLSTALTAQEMLESIRVYASLRPEYQAIYDTLSSDEEYLNLVYSTFSLSATESTGIFLEADRTTVDISNKSALPEIVLADRWYKSIIAKLESQVVDYNQIKADYLALKNKVTDIVNKQSDVDVKLIHEEIKQIYSRLGLELSTPNNVFSAYTKDTTSATENLQALLNEVFGKKGLESLINELVKLDKLVKKNEEIDKDINTFEEFGNLRRFAKRNLIYERVVISNVSRNVKGKMINLYQNSSYLSDFFKLVDNKEEFLNFLLNEVALEPAMKYSVWLFGIPNTKIEGLLTKDNNGNYILNTPVYNRFKRTRLDGIKNTETDSGQKYTELGYNDWVYTLFTNYVKTSGANLLNPDKKVAYVTPIPSDKSNIELIGFGRIILTKNEYDALTTKSNRDVIVNSDMFKAILLSLRQEILKNKQAADFMFNKDANGQYNVNDVKLENEYSFIQYYHTSKDGVVKEGKVTGKVFQFHNHRFLDSNGKLQTFDSVAEAIRLTVNGVVNPVVSENIPNLGLSAEQFTQVEDFLIAFMKAEVKVALEKTTPINNTLSELIKDNEGLYKSKYGIAKEVDAKSLMLSNISAEMWLNYFISNIEQQNLFGLHPSFYKNDGDTNKRAAQLQGSGLKGSFSEKTFNLLTIRDAEIAKILNESVDVNIGDGQSYITVEAFETRVRGLGLNKLKKYKNFEEVIAKLKGKEIQNNDGTTTILYEDLTREEKEIIFQIQKNFYYDFKFNPTLNIRVPFQIKNSEAILAPQIVKGTELQTLLRIAKQFDVAQINFESAEKVGTMSKVQLTDKNTGDIDLKNPEVLQRIQQGIRKVDYANLRQQLEVPNHIEDEVNKLGTQLARKIIDNLSNDAIYELDGKSLTGEEVKKSYFEILNTNIIESYEALKRELNIKDGKLDLEKLSEILLKNSTKVDANLLYALQVNNGNFNIPLFYGGFGDKFVTMLLSLATNNVINQKHPGGHAAQFSNAFFKKIKQDSNIDKGFTTDLYLANIKGINWLDKKDTGKLKYTQLDESGKIQKAEVLLPAWTKEFFINGQLIDINDPRLTEKARTLLGYRIPTEAKYSAIVFEVVGFLPETFGSTIVLPDEFVAQSGADFDIDSIYMMQYNTQYNNQTDSIDVIEYLSGNTEEDIDQRFANFIVDREGQKVLEDLIADTTTVKWYNSRIEKARERKEETESEYVDLYISDFKNTFGVEVKDIKELLYELKIMTDSLITIETGLTKRYLDKESTKEEYQSSILKLNTIKRNLLAYEQNVLKDFNFKEGEIADLNKKYKKYIANERKKLNALKYEEFKKLSIPQQNTLKARQNRILDIYVSIMTNPYHLKEILSGSQFDATKKAGAFIRNLLEGNKDELANPATLDAQLNFRVLNLSGRDLKGMSVNRDGLMSIMQHLKGKVMSPITIKIEDKTKYTELKERYKKDFNEETGILKLRYVANSPSDNFNINGEYITNYAAQSTAHILDNVKFPVPPNVNDYTFGVWRVPVELGATWEYATYFISQPILRKLVSHNQNSQSIVGKNKRDTAVKDTRQEYLREVYRNFREVNPTVAATYERAFKNPRMFTKELKEKFVKDVYAYLAKKDITILQSFSEENLIALHKASINPNLKNNKSIYLKYLLTQLNILDLWGTYSEISKNLELANTALSSDKKQVGPTFENYEKVENDREQLKTKDFLVVGEDNTNIIYEVFENKNYPVLSTYQEYGHDYWVKMFEQFFIFRSNDNLRALINATAKNGQVYSKKYKQHLSKLMLYNIPFFRNINSDILLGTAQIVKPTIDVTNNDDFQAFTLLGVYDKLELLQANQTELGINTLNLLHNTNLEVKKTKRGRKYLVYNNNDKGEYLLKGFENDLKGNNLFIADTLKDLIKLAFLDNGLTYGLNYNSVIPFSYLNENQDIQLSQHLYNVQRDGLKISYDVIERTFAIANYENNAIVPALKWEKESFYRNGDILEIDYKFYKELGFQVINKNYIKLFNPNTKQWEVFAKYLENVVDGEGQVSFAKVTLNTNLHQQLTKPTALTEINEDNSINVLTERNYKEIGKIKNLAMSVTFGEGSTMNKREGIKSDNTFDAILEGVRTATSRKDNSLDDVNVGDIISFSNNKKEKVFVRVTDKRRAIDISPAQWASKEGYKLVDVQTNWTKGKNLSSYTQIVFEVVARPGEDFANNVKKSLRLENLTDYIAKFLSENKLNIDETYKAIGREFVIEDIRIKDTYLSNTGKSYDLFISELSEQFTEFTQEEIAEEVKEFMVNYPNGAVDYTKDNIEPKFEEVTHNDVQLIKDSQLQFLNDTQITLQRELYINAPKQTGVNKATGEKEGVNLTTLDLLDKLSSLKGVLETGKFLQADIDKLGITREELDELALQSADYSSDFVIYKSLLEIGNYQEKQATAIRIRLEQLKTKYGLVDENNNFDFSKLKDKRDTPEGKEIEAYITNFIYVANGFLTSFLHIRDIKFYNEANAKVKLEKGIITKKEYDINELILLINQVTSGIESIQLQVREVNNLFLNFIANEVTKSGEDINIFEPMEDATGYQYIANALIYTNNPVVQNIIKDVRIKKELMEFETKRTTEEFKKKYNEFLEKGGNVESLFHKNAKGEKTGRLINYYNIDEFEAALEEEKAKLNKAKADFEQDSPEYVKALKEYNAWLTTFTERYYTPNYYEEVQLLPEDAVDFYVGQTKVLREIYSKYTKGKMSYDEFSLLLANTAQTSDEAKADYAKFNLAFTNRDAVIIEKYGEKMLKNIKAVMKLKKANPNYREGQILPKRNKFVNASFNALTTNEKIFLEYLRQLLNSQSKNVDFGIVKDGYIPVLLKDGRKAAQYLKNYVGLYTKLEKPSKNLFDKNGKLIQSIEHGMIWEVVPLPEFVINPFDVNEGITEAAYEVRELERLYEELDLKFATLTDAKKYQIATKEYNQSLVGKTHGENIIYDLETLIPLFIKESNDYTYKKQTLPMLLNLRDSLVNREMLKVTSVGKRLVDEFASKVKGKDVVATEKGGEQSNIVKQLDYYIDNNIFDYDGEETQASKYARLLQNYTSVAALGLNPMAATANVIYGKIQTMIEAVSGNGFTVKDYTKARLYYDKAITSYIGDVYKGQPTTEQNGLIHYFDIMFKQNEQVERDVNKKYSENDNTWYRQVMKTNIVFFMNNVGEHLMQNQVLFSMLYSHRVIGGKFFTYNDFIEGKLEKLSLDLSPAESKTKIAKMKEQEKQLKKEFETYPIAKDIFEFDAKTGGISIKPEYEVNEREIADFKLKVIAYNHKLHGIYNKEDKSAINRWVIGRLLLQFKKWLAPGWNKRFGSKFNKEFYNEFRQEKDKGTYTSLFQFILSPMKGRVNTLLIKDFNYFQDTMKAITRDYTSLITRGQLHWFTLSTNERANIISAVMELLYMAGAIVALAILKNLGDDDDELKDSKAFNFLLYQVDRIKTELATYTPIYGWINESSKLMQSPAASFGTIKNAIMLSTSIMYYPFQEDEQRIFQGGAYSGEYKTKVYAIKMIPFYNKWQRLEKIEEMNRAYKLF